LVHDDEVRIFLAGGHELGQYSLHLLSH
jgi:hypothetical protein